jgi:hypothetical protein
MTAIDQTHWQVKRDRRLADALLGLDGCEVGSEESRIAILRIEAALPGEREYSLACLLSYAYEYDEKGMFYHLRAEWRPA